MIAGAVFDIALVALLVALAAWSVSTRSGFTAIVGFIGYGVLLVVAWMRLRAPDVALTEGTIAAGLGGVLLLTAQARVGESAARTSAGAPRQDGGPSTIARIGIAILCAFVGASLIAVVLSLPEPAPSLAPLTAEALPRVGLGNPVNAVLLGARALDTLLEKVVVFLAVIGVWSLSRDHAWGSSPSIGPRTTSRVGGAAGGIAPAPAGPIAMLARIVPPFGIVVAGYLLWNGANEPGGAFASAAMLAAMALLVLMAGLGRIPRCSQGSWRATIVAGPLLFMAVALLGLPLAGAFLAFPEAWSKPIIVVIEIALVISVASALVLLIAGPPTTEPSP